MSKRLIYAEDAIDALNTLFKKQVTQFGYEGYEEADEKTQLVCDGISESIGCLLDMPSAQPIDIQDILEYLDTVLHPIVSPEHWDIYSELYDMISALPSAQPEQRWIPVTEKLPEVGQWVLCQCRANIMDVLRLTDDDCWYRKSNEIYMSGFVLAWMPLPEPWKDMRGEQG